jgi:glycerol-3-phosphate dehydrogenase
MQDEQGKVIGAHCRDRLSGKEWDTYAKVVLNATGAFADDVRRSSDPK